MRNNLIKLGLSAVAAVMLATAGPAHAQIIGACNKIADPAQIEREVFLYQGRVFGPENIKDRINKLEGIGFGMLDSNFVALARKDGSFVVGYHGSNALEAGACASINKKYTGRAYIPQLDDGRLKRNACETYELINYIPNADDLLNAVSWSKVPFACVKYEYGYMLLSLTK